MNKVIPLTILLGFTLPVLAAPTLIAEQGKEEGGEAGQRAVRIQSMCHTVTVRRAPMASPE